MKITQRILATLVVLLAAALSLSAGGNVKEYLAKLKQELNLTDAQVSQLEQKFDTLHPQGVAMEQRIKALRGEIEMQEKSASPDQKVLEQKKAELEAAKKEWKEKVASLFRSVLNADQFAKWQQMESNYQHEKEKEKKESSEKKKDQM